MKFERVHDWPAPADEVLAMLLDRDFREEVCREQEATSYDVEVSSGTPPATVKAGDPLPRRDRTADGGRPVPETTSRSRRNRGGARAEPGGSAGRRMRSPASSSSVSPSTQAIASRA